MSKQKKTNNFNDVVFMPNLVKQTLMEAAFPAMITSYQKDGLTLFKGFLPGFEFCDVEDIEDEQTCLDYLQDRLDDEVEELIVLGKSLPNIESDEKLLQNHFGYKIVYLDINVFVEKDFCEDCDCSCGVDGNCKSHKCHTNPGNCSCKTTVTKRSDEMHCHCDCCDGEDDGCSDDCGCGGDCDCANCTCDKK